MTDENTSPNMASGRGASASSDCGHCGHFCERAMGLSKPKWTFRGDTKPKCCLCRAQAGGLEAVENECGSCAERRMYMYIGYEDSKNSLLTSPSPAPSPSSRCSPFTLISPMARGGGFTKVEPLLEEEGEEEASAMEHSLRGGIAIDTRQGTKRNTRREGLEAPLMQSGGMDSCLNEIDPVDDAVNREPSKSNCACQCSIQ